MKAKKNPWDYFIRKVSFAIYTFYLTNKHGFQLKKSKTIQDKSINRLEYCNKMAKILGLTIETEGKENIEPNKQYIIAINHRSVLDPVISEIALDKTLPGYWIAKKELSKSPFYKSFVNNAGTIIVDRDNTSQSSFFSLVKDKIKNEKSNIFIFPEGTRNKTNSSLNEFKPGINIMALKNKLDILPVYIQTHSNELVNNALEGQRQVVKVVIGKPISYKTRNIKLEFEKTFDIS